MKLFYRVEESKWKQEGTIEEGGKAGIKKVNSSGESYAYVTWDSVDGFKFHIELDGVEIMEGEMGA